MTITLPEPSLVVLVGASGSGKSTFAARHFAPTEVLSSDFCRGLVSDDENDQAATKDAFEVLHYIAAKRLRAGRLTVVDATNVQRESRRPLVQLAREHDLFAVAVVIDLPEAVCHERNRSRPDRDFGSHVIRQQRSQLRKSMRGLKREGFHRIFTLTGQEEIETAAIERTPLWTNRSVEPGPFDVIGDVHGCRDELVELLGALGYRVEGDTVTPPEGRRAVFVGDYGDRGPDTPGVLRLVMRMAASGAAFCVPGNHDTKLVRKLKGRDVQVTHGLGETLEQLKAEPDEFRDTVRDFLDGLVSHYVLDGGRLVVAHAGLKEQYQGRSSARVRDFALFGETTGETDEFGLPVRGAWADSYRGKATVVYGHTPTAEAEWVNNTINIDTGCVFGGRLSALRWPERELVSVPAARTYYEPARPFLPEGEAAAADDARPAHTLDLADVLGKRIVQTRLARTVTVRDENAAAAIEVMGRFAVDPRWLVYLPPTMAPTQTSKRPLLLEHPEEAFAEYRSAGVPQVICEEKHMGSRAIAVVCRDADVASERFGVASGAAGALYTRTGRPFFDDATWTDSVLARLRASVDAAGLWDELETGWLVIDAELLPWSAKALELVRTQYAAVGAAARASLGVALDELRAASARELEGAAALLERSELRLGHVDRYVEAYRRYCWAVAGPEDVRLAPFHLLAGESGVYVERDHGWHLDLIDRLVAASEGHAIRTNKQVVDVTDEASQEAAIAWWEELTAGGGEGMVVKPLSFVARGRKGIVQPGIKCRGRDYLRIIYGPEYAEPDQIERLRSRSLGRKRSLALREFGLGVEALERFARREPLYRVHECVFAVLALESEPVDPRL